MACEIPGDLFDMGRNFNDFYNNQMNDKIPFMLERKYCYHRPQDRDGTHTSRYHYIVKDILPTINTHDGPNGYANDFIKPDDELKKIVNKFTNNIIYTLGPLNSDNNTLQARRINNKINANMKKYQQDKIDDLNTNLSHLNNQKYKNKRGFQNLHFSYNSYKFDINLITNSLIFITTMFCIHYLSKNEGGFLSPNMGLYLNCVIMTIFAFYLLINLNSKHQRNKANWNQINFKNIKASDDV